MSKNAKIYVAIAIVIVLGIIIYFVMNKQKDAVETTTSTSQTSGLSTLDLGGIFGSLFGRFKFLV